MWAGDGGYPTGWLACNGQAISRTTYAALFAKISTIYGAGNGTTTFNVPNLKARFPVGLNSVGTFNTLGAVGGAETDSHHHGMTRGTTTASRLSVNEVYWNNTAEGSAAAVYSAGGAASVDRFAASTTSTSVPTVPPYIVLDFIICALP